MKTAAFPICTRTDGLMFLDAVIQRSFDLMSTRATAVIMLIDGVDFGIYILGSFIRIRMA